LGVFAVVFLAGCATPFSIEGMASVAKSTPAAKERLLPPGEGAEVCLTIAASLEANGHDKEALVQYERARQFDPRNVRVARKLAVLYDRIGEHKRAVAEFQRALEQSPKDADLLNDLGYCYYNKGKWNEAEDCFRRALELNARHAHAWVNLGLTLGQLERYEEALSTFGKAVGPAEAQANLGFVYMTQGKHEEALKAYQDALVLDPDLKIAQAALRRLQEPAENKTE
jgi:Tfp pilus assembly protein PilF